MELTQNYVTLKALQIDTKRQGASFKTTAGDQIALVDWLKRVQQRNSAHGIDMPALRAIKSHGIGSIGKVRANAPKL